MYIPVMIIIYYPKRSIIAYAIAYAIAQTVAGMARH